MAIFFDAPVAPDTLNTYVRNVPTNSQLRLSQMFPVKYHDNNEVETGEVVRTNRTARFRPFDGRIHKSTRDVGSTKKLRLAPVSTSLDMGEYERLQLEFARTAGTNTALLARSIYNDADNLTREIHARWEQAWGDVLTDWKLTINEEEFITEADFGAPAGHAISAGTAYTTIATAPALADFVSAVDVYIATNGFAPAKFLTSTRVLRLLQQNTQIINAIKGSAAGASRVKAGEVDDLFSSEGLPTALPAYDSQVDIDGTSTRVIADDKIIFLPPNLSDLGHLAVGVSATALELVGSNRSDLTFADAPGIAGVVIKDGPPFRSWTYVDAVGFPVLDNPKLLMVLDVI